MDSQIDVASCITQVITYSQVVEHTEEPRGLTIEELTELGKEGWVLCTITPTRSVFARVKQIETITKVIENESSETPTSA